MSRFNTITGPGGQPLAQPAPIAASAFQAGGGAIQAAADTVARFAQASIARDQRMLLTQTQTDLISGVETARIEALSSANPTEAAEAFDKSIELLLQRNESIDNEEVRFEASQFLERRALSAKSSLINESTRKATAEDLVILDTFLKEATLEGDINEAEIQIFDRVGTTLTQGQAESMFRAFKVDTQLEFMNQVIRTEPQNFETFMDAGAFDLLNEGTLLAATGMASRAHDQFHKVDSERAFNAAKDDINDLISEGFKPDSLAEHLSFHTEVILSEPGNDRSSDEIQTALLGPGLTAASAELQPEQFEAIAALMPKTPENRELIATERRDMNALIEAGQVTAEGADVIGAVLDHGAKGLELPRDAGSWNKYVDRRLVAGDSVSDIAIDVLGADQPLPQSIVNGMRDMSDEATLDMGGLLAIYENMDMRDAIALSSTMPQPELNNLLRDTAQNTTGDERRRRIAVLENPRVRAAIPDAAIRFDGGKIGDKEHDPVSILSDASNLFGNALPGFFDPNIVLVPDQIESMRESFIFNVASSSGIQGFDIKTGNVDFAVNNSISEFIDSTNMFRVSNLGFGDTVAFTDQVALDEVGYQTQLDKWESSGTKQPGMIFNFEGMKATPSVANGIVGSFMVFDPEGKTATRVLRPTDAGYSEARDIFYGRTPPHQRVERPDLSYLAKYGNVHPIQISSDLNNRLMLEAVKKWTSLSGRSYTIEDQQEVLDVYNQLKSELGWPSVPPPE